jgi:uncharacterized protein YbaR (Trm112 family)
VLVCPVCSHKLRYLGSIRMGPKGGLRRVYGCTNAKCPYRVFR